MKCRRCRRKLPDNTFFCPYCGESLINKGKILGFRSGKTSNKIIAGIYYIYCFAVLISALSGSLQIMEINGSTLSFRASAEILFLLALFTPPIVLSEFPYRNKIPLFNRRKWYMNLIGFIIIFAILFTGIFFIEKDSFEQFNNFNNNQNTTNYGQTNSI